MPCIALIGFHKTRLGATTAVFCKWVLRRRRRIDRVASGANCVQPRCRRRRELGVDSGFGLYTPLRIHHCGRGSLLACRDACVALRVHRCADVTNLHPRIIRICSVCIPTVIARHSSHEKCKCVRVSNRRLSVSVTWVSSHVCPYPRKLKLAADL